jgi:cyclophilin family peptidyl-prolyl cis-trans isomerase
VNLSLPAVGSDTSDDQNVNLTGVFTDPNVANTVVTFNTPAGPMNVLLQDGIAPQTVANFLNYLAEGAYNNDVFHRLDTSPPVLQGGGFTFGTDPSSIVPISVNPAINNEFNATNADVAGTIAMAKQGGNANSATSQFFFNLADNSTTLGSSNNGGFTVFGKVLSPEDQRILNTLAAFPVKNESQTIFGVQFTAPGPKPTMTATSSLTGTQAKISVATTTNGSFPSIQAAQTITFSGKVTGGTFTLTLGTATTGPIKWSADKTTLASNIQKALNLLANTKVTVTSSTNPFNVFPVKDYKSSPFPANATASNFDLISSINKLVDSSDHLSFAITNNSNPSVVQASLNANDWVLLHPLATGSSTITVTATDDFGSTAQFNLTVNVPVAITSNFGPQTNLEGDTPTNLQATATDANSLPLTFAATGLPQGLNMSPGGLISGTIANNAHTNSPYTVVVTASDTSGSSASQSFTWTVNPVVTMTAVGDQTNNVGTNINLQVQGQDAKSNTLKFSATHLPTGLSIDSSGKITGKLTAKGTFDVTITATDTTNSAFSNTQSFKWTVH